MQKPCVDPPEHMLGPWQGQAFAELGFIVVNIDGWGTPLRSREFHHYSHNNLQSGGGLEDHIAVIKQLSKKYSYMDTERIGIIGWSQGGYAATRALLAYPDFYKVGVSFAGDHELRTYLSFWGEKVQGLGDDTCYYAYSNCKLAHKLEGKLFLIHGELDDNVHPSNTMQMVNALIKADKDFDMLLVPNENHSGFSANPYVIRRMWEYLVEHLK
jgi:dipeptidyl-peptidase 4